MRGIVYRKAKIYSFTEGQSDDPGYKERGKKMYHFARSSSARSSRDHVHIAQFKQ